MTDSYNIFDIALPPSPDGPMAEMLYMEEALVEWEGDMWVGHDLWEPVGNLTKDMRKIAWAMLGWEASPRRPISKVARRRLV